MCCVSMLFRVGSVGGVSCSLPLLLLRRGVEKADDAMVVGCLIGEDSRELIVLVVLIMPLLRAYIRGKGHQLVN